MNTFPSGAIPFRKYAYTFPALDECLKVKRYWKTDYL